MPEKVIHDIRLNQYSAVPADRTRRFPLGTKDSYGIEQLRIVPGEGWDGLTITATFHPPEGEAVQVLVPADGLIDVPPEATRSGSELPLKYGKIVFAGVADGMQRISCNLPYTVLDHAPVEGAESSGPAPSWYEQAAAHFLPGRGKAGQVLAKASDADLDVEWADGGGSGTSDHAKLSNRDAADQHPISAITGLQKELDGKQPAGNYLTADSLQAATDAALAQAKASGEFDGADGQPGENGSDGYSQTANVPQTENGATITVTDKNGTTTATVTNGKDGSDGNPGADGKDGITPTIGENGNWYLGETDTGKPSRGADGATGATGATGQKGTDGKSAYQYAQDGGYTGTEAEFAAKLAEEMPDKLPNPNALTFTGAVTGSYDGSAPLSVEIPSGGSGSYTLPVASPSTLGGVMPAAKTDDMTQAVGVDAEGGLWALPGGGSMKMELLAELRGDGEGISFSATFDGIEKLGLYLLHFKVDGADAENTGNQLYAKFGGSGVWGNGIRSLPIATTNNQYDHKILIMLIITDGLGNAYIASGAERGLNDSLEFPDSENKIINGVVSLYSQNSKPVFSGASVRLWRLL